MRKIGLGARKRSPKYDLVKRRNLGHHMHQIQQPQQKIDISRYFRKMQKN
jgi:hypothetical protein